MNLEPVVVDSNVFISAALSPSGTPRRVIDLIANGNFVIIQSQRLLRPKRTEPALTVGEATDR